MEGSGNNVLQLFNSTDDVMKHEFIYNRLQTGTPDLYKTIIDLLVLCLCQNTIENESYLRPSRGGKLASSRNIVFAFNIPARQQILQHKYAIPLWFKNEIQFNTNTPEYKKQRHYHPCDVCLHIQYQKFMSSTYLLQSQSLFFKGLLEPINLQMSTTSKVTQQCDHHTKAKASGDDGDDSPVNEIKCIQLNDMNPGNFSMFNNWILEKTDVLNDLQKMNDETLLRTYLYMDYIGYLGGCALVAYIIPKHLRNSDKYLQHVFNSICELDSVYNKQIIYSCYIIAMNSPNIKPDFIKKIVEKMQELDIINT
jgi:hypothetical protein